MKVLHIDSAITGEYSVSRQLSASIVERMKTFSPDAEITYRDVAANPLPHVELHSLPGDGSDAAKDSAAVLDEFLAADTIVIGAPMYNFTVPSQLKAWIDRILTAGKTFHYTANGPEGLAGGKRVIVATTRGGYYGEGAAAASFEHAQSYLRAAFNFIGIEPEFVVAEGLKVSDEVKAASISDAGDAITAIAA